MRVLDEMTEMFYILIMMIGAQLHISAKARQIIHSKLVNFVCNYTLIKADKNEILELINKRVNNPIFFKTKYYMKDYTP